MSTFELVDHDHWTKVSPTDPRTFASYNFEVKRQLAIRGSRVHAGTHAYEEKLGGSCGHTGVNVPSVCVTPR